MEYHLTLIKLIHIRKPKQYQTLDGWGSMAEGKQESLGSGVGTLGGITPENKFSRIKCDQASYPRVNNPKKNRSILSVHHCCCCCCYVALVVSDSVRPHRRQPTRLPIPGILQARTLEWVAISFSNVWELVMGRTHTPRLGCS